MADIPDNYLLKAVDLLMGRISEQIMVLLEERARGEVDEVAFQARIRELLGTLSPDVVARHPLLATPPPPPEPEPEPEPEPPESPPLPEPPAWELDSGDIEAVPVDAPAGPEPAVADMAEAEFEPVIEPEAIEPEVAEIDLASVEIVEAAIAGAPGEAAEPEAQDGSEAADDEEPSPYALIVDGVSGYDDYLADDGADPPEPCPDAAPQWDAAPQSDAAPGPCLAPEEPEPCIPTEPEPLTEPEAGFVLEAEAEPAPEPEILPAAEPGTGFLLEAEPATPPTSKPVPKPTPKPAPKPAPPAAQKPAPGSKSAPAPAAPGTAARTAAPQKPAPGARPGASAPTTCRPAPEASPAGGKTAPARGPAPRPGGGRVMVSGRWDMDVADVSLESAAAAGRFNEDEHGMAAPPVDKRQAKMLKDMAGREFQDKRRLKSPTTAALLSVLVAGVGDFYVGAIASGLLFYAAYFILVVLFVLRWNYHILLALPLICAASAVVSYANAGKHNDMVYALRAKPKNEQKRETHFSMH